MLNKILLKMMFDWNYLGGQSKILGAIPPLLTPDYVPGVQFHLKH